MLWSSEQVLVHAPIPPVKSLQWLFRTQLSGNFVLLWCEAGCQLTGKAGEAMDLLPLGKLISLYQSFYWN